jgi:DNA replication protein DnaC
LLALATDSAPPMSNVYPFAPLAVDEQARRHHALVKPVMDRDLQELQAARRAADRRRIERDAGNARIPAHYVGMTFDDYRVDYPDKDQDAIRSRAWSFVFHFERVLSRGSNLIFSGTTGTGKTALACVILQHLFTTGYTGLYTEHEAMRCHIRAAYDDGAKHTEQDAINAYLSPELLVIDELEGAKGNPDTIRKDLHRVINGRYSQSRPTILISNLTPANIRLYLGLALWGRMTSAAQHSAILRFDWPDYRLPQ